MPLTWETSKILTTESVQEAGDWHCVVFYRLSSETSLIFQSTSRANYGFQIHRYCNFSADFALARESKILQELLKLLLGLFAAERGGPEADSEI